MADRMLSTTPLRELGLTVACEVYNDRELAKDKDGNPINPKKPDQYILDRWNDLLDSYVHDHKQAIFNRCAQRWPSLTSDQRQTVLTDLGVAELAGASVPAQLKILAAYGIDAFTTLSADKQNEVFGILMGG